MVLNLTTFVLLACVCVTINAKTGLLYTACMKIRKGFTDGSPHYVRPIILPQVQDDWEMPLPECVGETNGIDVTVCDSGKRLPAVKFTDSSTVVVHRTGTLESFIVVRITLHCSSPQDELSGKIPPPFLKK